MRYIDTHIITPSPDWLTLAKAALGNTHKALWSFLKPQFETIAGKKCWFSESSNIGADNAVEHFRPKAQDVKELQKRYADLETEVWAQIDSSTRSGYPFLALEFMNYRYVCTFVNSPHKGHTQKVRGKSNFFPLKLNSPYGTSIADVGMEEVCLLDPCEPKDPEYITFNDLGQAVPNISITKFSWEYCRVMVSIEVYHLHYYRFVDARKQVWDECKELIEFADELSSKAANGPLINTEINSLKNYISLLLKKIDIKAPFSAVAIDCIRYYRGTYPWLAKHFPDDKLQK